MREFPWGYVVGAAVTVVGLLLNQWRADRRESEHWSKEVGREELKWERERAERLEQWRREDQARIDQWKRDDQRAWFDERRVLYAQSLRTFRAHSVRVREALRIIEPGVFDKKQARIIDELFEADDALRQAVSDVEVIASDPVAERLERLGEVSRDAVYIALWATDEDDVAKARETLQAAEEAYRLYFLAVRHDLGIAERDAVDGLPKRPTATAPIP